jgi:cell division protein FtsW
MRPSQRRRPVLSTLQAQRRHRPDYWLVILSALLLAVGLIVIYAISPGISAVTNVSEGYYVSKQLIAIGLGIAGCVACAFVPLNWLRKQERVFIGLAILSAALVQLFGEEVNGAARWIHIGGFSFQAAELIKFALLIGVAAFLSDRIQRGELGDVNRTLKPLLYIMAGLGFIVAKLQSDLGSAGVMVMMIAMMAFVAGMPLKRIALVVAVILSGMVLAIASSSYRRERVMTFLNPTQDCQSAGYQSCQALITLGSGGFGKGLGKSVQAYGYLPEAANDSIFAVLGEKFGFVGLTFVLGLFVALFSRLKRITERTADTFSRLLITGILVWLSTQTIINVGAMVGLLPLKGITLPFISYGGTSLVFTMIVIGLAFQISRYTAFAIVHDETREGASDGNTTVRRGNRRPYYTTYSSRP